MPLISPGLINFLTKVEIWETLLPLSALPASALKLDSLSKPEE